jgi:hypothetical protein
VILIFDTNQSFQVPNTALMKLEIAKFICTF